jgi:hypothetical protein
MLAAAIVHVNVAPNLKVWPWDGQRQLEADGRRSTEHRAA